jgi:hypothetical protein
VRKESGPIATPDVIQFALALPKTRSGKIMRRILRKIAENDVGNLGHTSTLADPGVVEGKAERLVSANDPLRTLRVGLAEAIIAPCLPILSAPSEPTRLSPLRR